MESFKASPFKQNRLKPVFLYNKHEDLEKCYEFVRNFAKNRQETEAEAREIQEKLRKNSDNHVCLDEKPSSFVGEKAIVQYQEFYKNLDKIIAENRSFGLKNSLLTEMLEKLEKNRLLPLKMGVVKLQGKNNELNLKFFLMILLIKFYLSETIAFLTFFPFSHYKIGDRYGSVLSETFRNRNDLQKIDLSDNQLRSSSASRLFHNMNKNTRKINLTNNFIGKEGCESLSLFIRDNKNL